MIAEEWTYKEYEFLKTEGFHQILDELKKNVSLTYFEFTDFKDQKRDFKEIQSELQINKDILYDKIKLRDNKESQNIEIHLKQIKLCLRFRVQLVLEDDKLEKDDIQILEHYLINEEHKIWILNLEYIDTKNISIVIRLLDKPNLNINNLDIISFGHKVLAQTDFIIFGKWLLNKFTDKRDNEDLHLRNLLFGWSNKPKRNVLENNTDLIK